MKNLFRYGLVYGLLLAAAAFVYLHEDLAVPANRPLSELPTKIGAWRMTNQSFFDNNTLAVLKPTDYLSRVYSDDQGRRITLYVGYHGGGPESGPIHSPKHCLPGSGWQFLESRQINAELDGRPVEMMLAVYQRGYIRQIFIYWFQVRGQSMTSEYALKFAEIKNSIFHNRRDSAFIRLATQAEGAVENAVELVRNFLREFYPLVNGCLPE